MIQRNFIKKIANWFTRFKIKQLKLAFIIYNYLKSLVLQFLIKIKLSLEYIIHPEGFLYLNSIFIFKVGILEHNIYWRWPIFYKSIKDTSILSGFIIFDLILYIYCFFAHYSYYTYWLYFLIIKFIIGIFYAVYFKSTKYPLINLYTSFEVIDGFIEIIISLYRSLLNPYYTIIALVYKVAYKLLIGGSWFKKYGWTFHNIHGWVEDGPLVVIILILFYFFYIVVALPTLILYIILKVTTELLKGNWFLLYEQLRSLFNKSIGLIGFILIGTVLYYFYLYQFI